MIGEESRIIDERRQLESQLNRLNAGKVKSVFYLNGL